jgi:Uma2 family endonuclease
VIKVPIFFLKLLGIEPLVQKLSSLLFETSTRAKDARNGVKLGWLINSQAKQVEVYRLRREDVEVRSRPTSLSGEDVLPSFLMDLREIWL